MIASQGPPGRRAIRVVLVSTYDLGHQPFGLASPAAWLARAGAEVACLDLAVESFDEVRLGTADLVAFHLPMHTATRLASRWIGTVRSINPRAHLCSYGLYASMNEPYLRRLGVHTVLGGEFESGLVSLLERLRARLATRGRTGDPGSIDASVPQPEPVVSLERQTFIAPDRRGLPPLSAYAHLLLPGRVSRPAGYTEASRGCKHLCRHCPIVPVYRGRFRIVAREVVLEDVRHQIEAGAEHITFGDPDFFNGIGHALPIVWALHAEHPDLTYDVTIKIEHLLRHAEHLPALRETGCRFVTSAVESIDDRVLKLLDKGHTRSDFHRAVELCRGAGVTLHPTFIPFTPWISIPGYRQLLTELVELDLIEQVAPIQLAIRLLIPAGSRLLELAEIQDLVDGFDEERLVHPWRHRDPEVDRLQADVQTLVSAASARDESRLDCFRRVWSRLEHVARDEASDGVLRRLRGARSAPVPHLTEPWYC